MNENTTDITLWTNEMIDALFAIKAGEAVVDMGNMTAKGRYLVALAAGIEGPHLCEWAR